VSVALVFNADQHEALDTLDIMWSCFNQTAYHSMDISESSEYYK